MSAWRVGVSSCVYCVGGASGSEGWWDAWPGGDVAVGGGVGEHCVVDPTFCFGLVELESDVGKCSGGCVEGVGDALVMHEERDIIHVRGDEDCGVVRGKRKGDLA